VIQGGSADVLKKKIVELHAERKHTGFLCRMTIHDEVVGDAGSPETLQRVLDILNVQSFPEFRVPIMWTGKAAPTWAGCK
jgi:DNA polymerase I-like protein with 3'-5' exonuclease and polymerase domains